MNSHCWSEQTLQWAVRRLIASGVKSDGLRDRLFGGRSGGAPLISQGEAPDGDSGLRSVLQHASGCLSCRTMLLELMESAIELESMLEQDAAMSGAEIDAAMHAGESSPAQPAPDSPMEMDLSARRRTGVLRLVPLRIAFPRTPEANRSGPQPDEAEDEYLVAAADAAGPSDHGIAQAGLQFGRCAAH